MYPNHDQGVISFPFNLIPKPQTDLTTPQTEAKGKGMKLTSILGLLPITYAFHNALRDLSQAKPSIGGLISFLRKAVCLMAA
jgi:hypothetical protein